MRSGALIIHAAVAGWLVTVLYSVTVLLAPPATDVIGDGILVIIGITVWSAVMRVLVAAPVVRIPGLVLGAVLITGLVVYTPVRRNGRTHLAALADDLGELTASIRRDVPPIDAEPLWGAIIVLLIALVTIVSLVLAVDAVGTAEVLVPGAAFVVVTLTVAARTPPVYTAGTIAAGVIVLALLVDRRTRSVHPTAARSALGRVPAVLGMAGVVAVIGVGVGPFLPGADRDAWIDLRARSTGVTTILSPLVDIRTRLTAASEDLMFTVETDTESYWRIASLPEFDGTTFRLPAAPLSTPTRPDRTSPPILQTIDIAALGGRLVPAAPDPTLLSGGLRWNADTEAVVLVDRELRTGDRFEIASIRPRRDPLVLAGATSDSGPAVTRTLPEGFSASILETARQVTAGSSNDYERALALQFWFREQFEYSLEFPAGHGIDSIERFLAVRRGYCEQFAAAYAAMGRGIGLSTRVAVGFTSGIAVDGGFEVLGRHAHAWPEVWFDGIGWVPFEPTPGRGAPGSEQHTGVSPAQDTDEPAVDETGAAEPIDDPLGGDDGISLTIPNDLAPVSPAPPSAGSPTGVAGPATVVTVVMVVIGLFGLVTAPVTRRRINRRRWARTPPDDQVLEVWETTRRALQRAGIAGDSATTTQEWAVRARHALPSIDRPISSLAAAVDRTIYSRHPAADVGVYGMSVGRASMSWWRQIHGFMAAESSWRQRVVDYWVRRI